MAVVELVLVLNMHEIFAAERQTKQKASINHING
jgi:hypothetical protein